MSVRNCLWRKVFGGKEEEEEEEEEGFRGEGNVKDQLEGADRRKIRRAQQEEKMATFAPRQREGEEEAVGGKDGGWRKRRKRRIGNGNVVGLP